MKGWLDGWREFGEWRDGQRNRGTTGEVVTSPSALCWQV